MRTSTKRVFFLDDENRRGNERDEDDSRRERTRGFVDGKAEARDCCASICNSRSICKRQRNLNPETKWMSLSRSAGSERICELHQPHIHEE